MIKLGESWGVDTFIPCDVASDDEIKDAFSALSGSWDGVDAAIHAVGFAPREELDGDFWMLLLERDSIAHDISSYSFIGLAKAAKPFMAGRQGSLRPYLILDLK